jgi:hypothetical protein
MNRKRAFEILDIREDASENEIKKAYRSKILQYHPDKNKSPDANERFIEVQTAFTYLRNDNAFYDECHTNTYNDMLNTFLSSVFREETGELISKRVEFICKKICMVVEHNADHIIDYLRSINQDTLKMIRDVLFKYKHVIHFSAELCERIDEILCIEECIILNPELDDLLSDENIYILKRDNRSYLVPLWHHEMTFEHNEKNIVVKNCPILPDNVEMDEYNVLTVSLQYSLSEIWDREVALTIGGKSFSISGQQLRLTSKPQRIEFLDCGMPFNNLDNILDVSKKQPIVFMVTVLFPDFT